LHKDIGALTTSRRKSKTTKRTTKNLTGVDIRMELGLSSTSLGNNIKNILVEFKATIKAIDHDIANTIFCEDDIFVIIHESISFLDHSSAMKKHFNGHRIFYIIQGLNGIDDQLVFLQTKINCFIKETKDQKETVEWIKEVLVNIHTNNVQSSSHKARSETDVRIIWRYMLSEIYGISDKMVNCIVGMYPNLRALREKYDQLSEDEAMCLFADVRIDRRKIGLVLSTRIYKVFTEGDPESKINQSQSNLSI
jgi:ERCC4-type nuclease